jgi:hypothetical protein
MRIMKVVALGLGMLVLSTVALHADTLVLTSTYSTIPFSTGNLGGGSLDGATLNGVALPWVYCLQVSVNVTVPGTYDETKVSTGGKLYNSAWPPPNAAQAAQIAWLLWHYAVGGSPNSDQEVALQAAIWHVEGFGDLGGGASAGATTLYNTMLAGVGSGQSSLIGNFLWMTPGKNGSNQYQGLVTRVPDGGITLVLLGGALLGVETLRRKLRA